eukprot:6917556-Prymnesium_polylepis.1
MIRAVRSLIVLHVRARSALNDSSKRNHDLKINKKRSCFNTLFGSRSLCKVPKAGLPKTRGYLLKKACGSPKKGSQTLFWKRASQELEQLARAVHSKLGS